MNFYDAALMVLPLSISANAAYNWSSIHVLVFLVTIFFPIKPPCYLPCTVFIFIGFALSFVVAAVSELPTLPLAFTVVDCRLALRRGRPLPDPIAATPHRTVIASTTYDLLHNTSASHRSVHECKVQSIFSSSLCN